MIVTLANADVVIAQASRQETRKLKLFFFMILTEMMKRKSGEGVALTLINYR